jgi:hypothetical protein
VPYLQVKRVPEVAAEMTTSAEAAQKRIKRASS